MLASLPMYDLAELRSATDAWWAGLRRALCAAGVAGVPARLLRGGGFGMEWHDPTLLLSQCCGWDLTHGLANSVQPIATPVYAAPGCSGPYYRSVIIVRSADPASHLIDLRGRVCAVNMTGSQSGYNTLRYSVARIARGRPLFGEIVISGSHVTSIEWVRNGQADVAAIDCVTFELLRQHRPLAMAGLRILALSRRAPSLPYITRNNAPADLLKRLWVGLQAALADPELKSARTALLISGFVQLPARAYGYIVTQQRRASLLAQHSNSAQDVDHQQQHDSAKHSHDQRADEPGGLQAQQSEQETAHNGADHPDN